MKDEENRNRILTLYINIPIFICIYKFNTYYLNRTYFLALEERKKIFDELDTQFDSFRKQEIKLEITKYFKNQNYFCQTFNLQCSFLPAKIKFLCQESAT